MMRQLSRTIVCLGVACATVCWPAASADAAPMTYKFQVTVGELPPFSNDIDLPFTLAEGSIIDGRLTIDSEIDEPFGGNSSRSVQPHSIELLFEGFLFVAEQYSTSVVNDSAIIGFGGDVIPADFVRLSCSTGAIDVACSSELLQFPGTPPLRFSIGVDLAGDIALLSEPRLPSEVATWNGFSIWRSIVIGFATQTGIGDTFSASLSPFTLVPEPHTVGLLLGLLAWLQLTVRRRPKIST